jgi:hypothetical protein
MLSLDPFALDRSIADTARLHARFLEAVAEGGGEEHAFELLPRSISRAALTELTEHAASDPIAASAARWVAHLLLEHAAIPTRLSVARALHHERRPLETPERGQWAPAQVIEKLLRDGPRREGWLAALTSVGEELGARRLAWFETLNEKRRELGLAQGVAESECVLNAGTEFLRATRDAERELRLKSFAELIERGLGSDVPGNWPSPLSPRKLGDWFRETSLLDGLSPQIGRLPTALGAASVLRALALFGSGVHEAGASRQRPFVVAHDPDRLRARSFGALFALLPLHASFAGRRLDVDRSRFGEYRRAIASVVLIGSRLSVVRALLSRAARDGASAYRRCFREDLPDALGFELSPRLAGALLVDEQGERSLSALFAAAQEDQALTERHDEDWFRNPRCIEELRGELESTPELSPDPAVVERGGRRLAALLLAAS